MSLDPTSSYNPNAPSSSIRNGSIDAFSPSSLFSDSTRARRRNFYASIFLSFCFIVFKVNYPNVALSSILIFRFDTPVPVRNLGPIAALLAAHLTYALISFLVELFSHMKREKLSFTGIKLGFESTKGNDEDNFSLFLESDPISTCEAPSTYLYDLENDGKIVLMIKTRPVIQVSRLFLTRKFIVDPNHLTLHKLEKEKPPKQRLYHKRINDGDDHETEYIYYTSLAEKYRSEILCSFRRHVYSSFVWWYEVLLPIVLSIFIVFYFLVS